MANLDFPKNPKSGQEYKGPRGKSYWWDGVKWAVKRPIIVTHSPEPEPTPEPVAVTPLELNMGGIDFPNYPVVGEEFLASNGVTYLWDGVKWVVNQNIIIDNGGGSVDNNGNYVLPTATNTRLGGVRIGTGIINQNGTISVDLASTKGDKGDPGNPGPKGDDGLNAYQIAVDGGFVGTIEQWLANIKGEKGDPGNNNIANSQEAGIVIIGDSTTNINISQNGTISVPIATNSTLGVVKPGTNVSIDEFGAISVTKGAGINTVVDIPDVNSTAGGAALNDGALLIYNASSERWDTIKNLRSDEMDGGFF
jgi:hypothetical protein